VSIEEIVNNHPYYFSLLTFFIGVLWGNWLAISRDKRKEFNGAADIVYHN
jgi:hypothetical protein